MQLKRDARYIGGLHDLESTVTDYNIPMKLTI